MAKKVTNGYAYTEDWLPVRAIQNGMIITANNQKVTGVKIAPRNIFILDPDAQNNVLISLKNFYNMIDFEFWLVVADRPVDISVYMSQLQLLYNEAHSPAIRKLIAQDINKGQTFINNNKNISITDEETAILSMRVFEDGRVIDNNEKISIINIMKVHGVPVTRKLFTQAVLRYLDGELVNTKRII